MMQYSDEILMAYVDGEVDSETREAVAAAALRDPGLAARIARHAALRRTIGAAYESTLGEPVPERLIAPVRRGSTTLEASPVTELGQARSLRQQRATRPWFRQEWTAVAASVAVGLAVGLLLRNGGTSATASDLIAFDNGLPTATGLLAQALSTQLASGGERGDAVRLGISFRAKSGEYCRTFALPVREGLAGLACREPGAWSVVSLERRPAPAAGTQDYRMAGSDAAPALIAAINEIIDGDPLDAAGEKAALENGWPRMTDTRRPSN